MENISYPGSALNSEELSRYSRHLSLPEIGIKGQTKIKSSSVLCIGSGGLGSPLLIYLAAAGVGKIGIVDFDVVEYSNLQRQIIHNTDSIGTKKTESSKEYLKKLNPFCEIEIFETKINKTNALDIIKRFDIICDCTDNFPSRYLINDACVILKKPNIYGSVSGFEGQASVFNLTEESPNYRDLIPNPPPQELIPSCNERGVIGVLPGIIGLIQATEAIKIITGIGQTLSGRLLVFDALKMSFKELNLKVNQSRLKIKSLINYDEFCSDVENTTEKVNQSQCKSISAYELILLLKSYTNKVTIIDVRHHYEFIEQSIPGSILIPLNEIENGVAKQKIEEINPHDEIYVYCKSGRRSIKAIKLLEKYGRQGINLTGGIDAWNQESV